MKYESRIGAAEGRRALDTGDGVDFSGTYLDTVIAIRSTGRVQMLWSRPQRQQPEPPAGARCSGRLTDPVRFFESDERPPDRRRIPASILFRRAVTTLHGWALAALDRDLTPEELRLREELLSERALADEREARELAALGIDPSEVDAAFEVVA